MRQIQESTSLLIEEATNAINKSGKISAREIKNLKLKDLKRELDQTPETPLEVQKDPSPTTLAAELGSSSIKFIRCMGFVSLAAKLEERLEEMSNGWRERENDSKKEAESLENRLKAEIIKLRSINTAQEKLLSSQNKEIQSLIEGLGNIKSEVELLNSDYQEKLSKQQESLDSLFAELKKEKQKSDAASRELFEEKEYKEKVMHENTGLHNKAQALEALLCKSGDSSIQRRCSLKEQLPQHTTEELAKLKKCEQSIGEKLTNQETSDINILAPVLDVALLQFAEAQEGSHNEVFNKNHVKEVREDYPGVQFSDSILKIFGYEEKNGESADIDA
jgi:hypothetical protein